MNQTQTPCPTCGHCARAPRRAARTLEILTPEQERALEGYATGSGAFRAYRKKIGLYMDLLFFLRYGAPDAVTRARAEALAAELLAGRPATEDDRRLYHSCRDAAGTHPGRPFAFAAAREQQQHESINAA